MGRLWNVRFWRLRSPRAERMNWMIFVLSSANLSIDLTVRSFRAKFRSERYSKRAGLVAWFTSL